MTDFSRQYFLLLHVLTLVLFKSACAGGQSWGSCNRLCTELRVIMMLDKMMMDGNGDDDGNDVMVSIY